jgi:hypothetical protein
MSTQPDDRGGSSASEVKLPGLSALSKHKNDNDCQRSNFVQARRLCAGFFVDCRNPSTPNEPPAILSDPSLRDDHSFPPQIEYHP